MFIYTHPQYPRTPLERFFKYAYVLTTLLNFSAFLITINDFTTRIDTTYENFWSMGTLTLSSSLSQLLADCERTDGISINGVTARTVINTSVVDYFFLIVTAVCIGIFVIHGMFICTDFCTKVLYTFNIRNFRIRGLIIRFTWVQPFWLALYASIAWGVIIASSSSRVFLQDYVNYCADVMLALDRGNYIDKEIDKDVVFGLNFTFIFVAIGVNMFVYLCALVHLIVYGCKRENKLIAQYEYPWERGCLGLPHRPMITAWNGARQILADALVRGTVDPDLDIAQLEAAVNFPSRYLEYFARLDPKSRIQVTLDEVPEADFDPAYDEADLDPSAAAPYYTAGGDGFDVDPGAHVIINEEVAPESPQRHHKHRSSKEGRHRRRRSEAVTAAAEADVSDAAAVTGDSAGMPESEGDRAARRHRRKSRQRRDAPGGGSSGGDGMEIDLPSHN